MDQALEMAGISVDQVGVFEVHDCFTMTGLLSVEALGLAGHGGAAEYVISGATRRDGKTPINPTGGLIGWGHPTGGSGVRMSVDLLKQLTGTAGDSQLELNSDRPYGLMISRGGNDKTVVTCVVRRGE